MEIQTKLRDFDKEDIGMPYLKKVLARVDKKEMIVEGFSSGNLTANEMTFLLKEEEMKL